MSFVTTKVCLSWKDVFRHNKNDTCGSFRHWSIRGYLPLTLFARLTSGPWTEQRGTGTRAAQHQKVLQHLTPPLTCKPPLHVHDVAWERSDLCRSPILPLPPKVLRPGKVRTGHCEKKTGNYESSHLITLERRHTSTATETPSCLRYLSPGMRVNTRYINSTRGTSSRSLWQSRSLWRNRSLWWSRSFCDRAGLILTEHNN